MTLWASSRGDVATNSPRIGQVGRVSEVCVSEDQLREALGFERMRRRAHERSDDAAAAGWREEATSTDIAAHLELVIADEDTRGIAGWWYDAPTGASRRWCLGVRLAARVGLHGPRRAPTTRSYADAGPSAWARSRGVIAGVRIGDFYADAAQVRAELDRVDLRWVTLKADVVRTLPATGSDARATFRRNFVDAFNRWRVFYADARNDVLSWGSNVDQAEAFDAELETWRARFVELGETPSNPTTSHTADRPSSLTEIGDLVRWIAIAAIVVGIAWALSSASSIAPRLVGAAAAPP